jgi:hypothetical protein
MGLNEDYRRHEGKGRFLVLVIPAMMRKKAPASPTNESVSFQKFDLDRDRNDDGSGRLWKERVW